MTCAAFLLLSLSGLLGLAILAGCVFTAGYVFRGERDLYRRSNPKQRRPDGGRGWL